MENVRRRRYVRDRILMLIKVTDAVKKDPRLVQWIEEIDKAYMDKYEQFGVDSLVHLAFRTGSDWDFALVFAGSEESAGELERSIKAKVPDQLTTILTLRGIDLDDFTAAQHVQTFLQGWRGPTA